MKKKNRVPDELYFDAVFRQLGQRCVACGEERPSEELANCNAGCGLVCARCWPSHAGSKHKVAPRTIAGAPIGATR